MLEVDPLTNAITMDRGDYFDPQFNIVDASGNPLDVTGASFALTVKKSIDDSISAAIFQLTSGAAQFDVSGQTGGVIKAKGPETLTQGIAGDYLYDLEMILAAKTRTVAKAAPLRIRKDVTTVGTPPVPPNALVPFPGAVSIDGDLYLKDITLAQYWKVKLDNGNWRFDGPSSTIPF